VAAVEDQLADKPLAPPEAGPHEKQVGARHRLEEGGERNLSVSPLPASR
jgi:hypothetical protein